MNDDQMQLARLEQLLEENLEIARDTNETVHAMRRTAWWGFWLKVILWAAVIILPFLLLKPILETLVPATAGTTGSGFFGFPSQEDLERAIDSYQGL